MGLLALGTPLPWSDAKQHAEYVREHGIEQFLNIYHRLKDRTGDRLLWGDEVRSNGLRSRDGEEGREGDSRKRQRERLEGIPEGGWGGTPSRWETGREVRVLSDGRWASTACVCGRGADGSSSFSSHLIGFANSLLSPSPFLLPPIPTSLPPSSLLPSPLSPPSFAFPQSTFFPTSSTSQVEYMVISYDDESKNARLSLRQTEILTDLQADAAKRLEASRASSPAPSTAPTGEEGRGEKKQKASCIPVFHPEYGRYMLESTPGEPYGATLEDLLDVEGNMRFRCVCFSSPLTSRSPPFWRELPFHEQEVALTFHLFDLS